MPLPAASDHFYSFDLDPQIDDPASFRVAFVILLDGDLVMSPEHLGVAYMTAVLRRAGFPVRVIEVVRGHMEKSIEDIQAFDPVLTCFTLMSLNVASCLEFCRLLRPRLPKTRIVCGGPAGSYAGLELLAINPDIEIVAVGEGEPTIFDLVQRLCLGESLEGCSGICFRAADGSLRQNPTRPLMHNLDELPFPARDQLELHGGKLEYVRVSTSRGCVARCSFCSAPNVGNRIQSGKAWRGRSPESVLDELTEMVGKYRFRTYDFVDSTFEDPDGGRIGKGRIESIARGIIERKLSIYYNCCMRAENWGDADHELLDLLVRSGLEKVNVGIESGIEEELRLWDKRATVADNVRIIRLLREHGIYLSMGFIQFHPYATVDTLQANAAFLRDHCGHNLRRLTERIEVYPGTPLIKRLESDGLLGESYRATLNPYDYRYRDERVQRLAEHFASLYNNVDYHERGVITEESAVFDFETFNVVVATFVSRTYRRFHTVPGARELLEGFKADLHAIHQQMGQFNYTFFIENLEAVLADRLDGQRRIAQVEEVERYFRQCMDEIRTLQLRLGMALRKLGVDLTEISSSSDAPVRALRTYTGGGTPCW